MSEIEDRRQRAREAGLDATVGVWDGEDLNNGLEASIEAATQVKITQEAIWAHTAPGEQLRPLNNAEIQAKIADILAALGFEVID